MTTRADEPGGSHVHLRDLAASLHERGHTVTIFAGGAGRFADELAELGLPFRSLRYLTRAIRPKTDLLAILELRRELQALRPDFVHAHSSKAGWVARAAAWSLGIPAVFTAHGFAFSEGVPKRAARVYALAERCAAPLASRIITVSEYDRKLALRRGVGNDRKLITVHNGITDIPMSLRAAPERSALRIVMTARFSEPKDHSLLFEALVGVRGHWTLDLIGDGPLRRRAEEQVAALGLQNRVRFLGHRRDVATFLAHAQIFVLVSKYEGLPLTILEAMRAGLPIVASDVGGIPETTVDGETGFLVPRGDVVALRDRLQLLVTNPAMRVRFGAAARARYERDFTFERMLHETLCVYQWARGEATASVVPLGTPLVHRHDMTLHA